MSNSSISDDVLPLLPDDFYDPSEIVLIGSHMKPSPLFSMDEATSKPTVGTAVSSRDLSHGHMRLRSDYAEELHLTALPKQDTDAARKLEAIDKMKDEDAKAKEVAKVLADTPTIALVYAYGYEGHTYRLTKPRIMIVQGIGRPYESKRDRDPSPDLTGKLYMWKLSKHHQTISIEVESGDLEQLVLEANQPGNRSVNSYAAHMQMSHRGGKLS